MIYAVVRKKNNNIVSILLRGHAESADEGLDMVCSAVSAVSITIANGITEVLKLKPEIELEDGFLSIDVGGLTDDEIFKSQVLMETMLLGIKSIENSFGSYIKVTVEEV